MIRPNKKQQECIDNIDGKYLVLAGPGTGKTFTLIQRVKSMIEKGIKPETILCLTFSDAAANEMRTRLAKELNKNNIEVNIFTYHSFCNDIITVHPEEFELPENYRVIPPAVSVNLLKECIDEIKPVAYRTKRNDPYYFINEISNGINAIKANRLTKSKFFENLEKNPDWKPQLKSLQEELKEKTEKGAKIPKRIPDGIDSMEKKIAKVTELWDFYELYKSKMEEQHYVDFNDMINYVLDKFEDEPSFLHKAANQYKYILVDEYQDTNKSQNDIVFHLTKAIESENVFVVGDDDQIIYGFQGAKLDTIEKFLDNFPETKVICLEENMRSTQQILDASRKFVVQDSKRLEVNPKFESYNISKELISKNKDLENKNKKVRFYKYADILQEYQEIVDEIANLVNSEDCPVDENGNKKLSEIAILTLSNDELTSFFELLKERNIPAELKDGKNIFLIHSFTVMYYYMQMLTNPELHSDKFFKLALAKPFNLHPRDFEILYNKKSQYISIIELVKSVQSIEFVELDKVEKFIKTFEYLFEYKTNETLRNIILEIGAKTGIFDYYINSEINRIENISGLKKLVDQAEDFSNLYKKISLEDFVEYLDMCLQDEISITTDKAPVAMNAVQLSTYHSAKGREFEYVYMPTLVRDKWESSRKSMKSIIPLDVSQYKTDDELKEQKISEQIKVLYVGMTRAKHTLRLSYPDKDGKNVKVPSALIINSDIDFEREDNPFEYDINSFWQERAKSIIKRDYDYKRDFCSMVDVYLEGKHYSPSSINTYLKCPRWYFYHYILNFGAKDGNPDAFSYGISVHKACETAVLCAQKNGNYPSKEDFIKAFKDKLQDLPMSTFQQREIYEKRGEDALDKFYTFICATPVSMLYAVEKHIDLDIDGVKFKGIIDRIDKNPDGTYTIYDYKTGSAKNEKIICEGGEHEDYYNQIGLYKYYFEKQTGKKVKETTFIYPEEPEKNFTLNLVDEDCERIKQKFNDAISDIKSYKFEPTYNPNACQYCPYSDFCDMEIL